jgi:hypothetical protein
MRRCVEMQIRRSPSGSNLQFSPAGFKLCWNTWASPPLPGTGSRKSHVQGERSSKPSQRIYSDPKSFANTSDQLSGPLAMTMLPIPPGRPSHRGSVETSIGCKTTSTTSNPTVRRINSRPMGQEGYSQDGDGTPPGCDDGPEHSSTGHSA